MDILRHGASVEVISPEHLARAVRDEHLQAAG
jgi:predicted DNA-binding transcriptional regulator YafY